ncbi:MULTISPECIES: hypothetical protein [Loigolactobacillus]|uniref:Uncharacterized protein n=1 Tax=Loigolactobacillus backii TaxID=375175 RepID=A0A192H2M3_9LACO|nr:MULTISPECIES: hypothetical protein [Loigolactobacillus]ANK59104.1 hypothetical protein AYR52_01770 [Loigolactobacillus backii]ANK62482.1 hypothetical protein AYR53_06705 [Loigolactobacillus backii]ANK64093.1 hypothetical protein AYR54_01760 [Loigolactobacillus backii]ANK67513.1 hypothetical protein AYR55_07280 [Loigolactobacillus backii]ANK70506.1 hypothetical protein AYR56_10285 [Loigolactobacillus backii]
MKTGSKILLGIGITTTLAATGAYLAADAIVEQIQTRRNRYKVKTFVRDNLKGNERILDLVDRIDNDDLNHLVNAVEKLSKVRNKAGVYVGSAGNAANELTATLKDWLHEYRH